MLKVSVGTVFVRDEGRNGWLLASPGMPLKEGTAIKTDQNSQALVTFFDESTITLLPDSELSFSTLRLSRYSFFAPRRIMVGLVQRGGKSAIGIAPPQKGSSRFEVTVPQGLISLAEGGYTLEVGGSLARIRVKEGGQATVTASGKTVMAVRGERIDFYSGAPPRPPEPSALEFMVNGDFADGLKGWTVENLPGFSPGADILGAAQVVTEEGRSAVRLVRLGSKGTHNETVISQDLDEDVSSVSFLRLSLEFKLVNQSLSGGGYMGSEYPLLIRIHYRSDNGESYVFKGFYYQNDSHNRTDFGLAVPFNTWYTWTMPDNLMAMAPVPRRITGIEIGASGHDYQSEIRRVSLTGE
ncbi:MAG: FecR domain-containing protein [Dehalococcoidia bacterium]|nr:FecR domain-containing protein [Dehalococcoidia bacterium]